MEKTEVRYGPRLGKEGRLRLGCSAVVFDASREKVLLTRRADNDLWCLPGGAVDAGESVAEACLRELWEETGLQGRVLRLIGVYSNPDQLVLYPDGNKAFIVALSFEVEATGGMLGLSSETTEVGYFTLAEVQGLDLIGQHRERVEDAVAGQVKAFVR
jgi:ADP-ribose pyrophosphatase YjhB (NUDIX family)